MSEPRVIGEQTATMRSKVMRVEAGSKFARVEKSYNGAVDSLKDLISEYGAKDYGGGKTILLGGDYGSGGDGAPNRISAFSMEANGDIYAAVYWRQGDKDGTRYIKVDNNFTSGRYAAGDRYISTREIWEAIREAAKGKRDRWGDLI